MFKSAKKLQTEERRHANDTHACSRGFTIVELIVTIAIISVVVAVSFAATATARVKATDAQRISDLLSLALNLEIYYSQYGVYPCGIIGTAGGARQTDGDWGHEGTADDSFLNSFKTLQAFTCDSSPERGLVWAGLISPGVRDPGGGYYMYDVTSTRDNYILYAPLQNDPNRMENDGGLNDCYYEVGPGVGTIPPFWLCP